MHGPEFVLGEALVKLSKISRDIHLAGSPGKARLLRNKHKA